MARKKKMNPLLIIGLVLLVGALMKKKSAGALPGNGSADIKAQVAKLDRVYNLLVENVVDAVTSSRDENDIPMASTDLGQRAMAALNAMQIEVDALKAHVGV